MIIAICDDEHNECERIRDYVLNIPKLSEMKPQVAIYEPDEFKQLISEMEIDSGSDKISDVVKDATRPDVVIMDIEFKGKEYDGIELTQRLNNVSNKTQIIYLTHILEFAPEVYDTEHCYFVMKNNMDTMLRKALDKALNIYMMLQRQKPLEIMSDGHKLFIAQEDILYIEKRQRQTIVHTPTSTFSCYESITSIVEKLSDDIVRCHGGYLVNLSHITYLAGEKLILDIAETELPVGKTYREQTKQAYLKYWMKRM